MLPYFEQKAAVQEAVATFPPQFGLRAFPGEVFRVSPHASYYGAAGVMIYTEIQVGENWKEFAKGTMAELTAEIIAL